MSSPDDSQPLSPTMPEPDSPSSHKSIESPLDESINSPPAQDSPKSPLEASLSPPSSPHRLTIEQEEQEDEPEMNNIKDDKHVDGDNDGDDEQNDKNDDEIEHNDYNASPNHDSHSNEETNQVNVTRSSPVPPNDDNLDDGNDSPSIPNSPHNIDNSSPALEHDASRSPRQQVENEPQSPVNENASRASPSPAASPKSPRSTHEEEDEEDALDESQIDSQANEKVGELIADIFGESESEEEFEGFAERRANISDDDDDEGEKKEVADSGENETNVNQSEVLPEVSSSSEDDDDDSKRKIPENDIVYDFDLMLQRKREESNRRRRRKNIDIINDNDDYIAVILQNMKTAADEDFEANKNRMAATRKLKLLSNVVANLRKLDLREAILDAGVLSVITDWLTPLPDRSLPHLQIRENMLKILGEFNIDDVERIKASGIGKAVMYLFKHPKETKENRRLAGQLISSWSRPIFSLDTDLQSMSKEEREQRDFEHMKKTKRQRRDSNSESEATPVKTAKTPADEKNLRPGEKGWVPRARVPMPSMKDYVHRPKSAVDIDVPRVNSKKPATRFDRHMRNFKEKKKLSKQQRAVPLSLEGRKMAL